jgi:hypothetical protein
MQIFLQFFDIRLQTFSQFFLNNVDQIFLQFFDIRLQTFSVFLNNIPNAIGV